MSASMIAKAAALKPEIRLAQAVSEFEASLAEQHKATFRSYRSRSWEKAPESSDVMRFTAEIDLRTAQQIGGGQCFGPRLTNILQAAQQYAALGDVVIGGSQNIIACGVWSLLRLTLLVSQSSMLFFCESRLIVSRRSSRSPHIWTNSQKSSWRPVGKPLVISRWLYCTRGLQISSRPCQSTSRLLSICVRSCTRQHKNQLLARTLLYSAIST